MAQQRQKRRQVEAKQPVAGLHEFTRRVERGSKRKATLAMMEYNRW
jgi:hypothetical protein